jgi:hypothetical protein
MRWGEVCRVELIRGRIDGSLGSQYKLHAELMADVETGRLEHRKDGPAQSSPSWFRAKLPKEWRELGWD